MNRRANPPAEPAIESPKETFKLSQWLAEEFGKALDTLRSRPQPKPKPAEGDIEKPVSQKKAGPSFMLSPETAPIPPIDRNLFVVPGSKGFWPDEAPLVEIPDGELVHDWTLKQSFEGTLILGRTGSGKSTGSGVTFARSFLQAGFGGLILTVKTGEAEHWRKLCAACGRQNDLVVVQRGGNWKLNLLACESQHPGRGGGLSENLTIFCRNLLAISSRSKGTANADSFWESAGNQLLNATFDLFQLAGQSITFDRLADFVAAPPPTMRRGPRKTG